VRRLLRSRILHWEALTAIPTERVVPIINEWLKGHSGKEWAERTGLSERRLYSIRLQEHIRFETVDRILVGLDLVDRWYTDLADVYSP